MEKRAIGKTNMSYRLLEVILDRKMDIGFLGGMVRHVRK